MISLYLMKSSEVRIAGDRSNCKMMTKWPHTTWKRTTPCWFAYADYGSEWFSFIHCKCGWKLFTSKTDVCNIQHSVVRFHVVCGHFVIILCLQIDRANLRFGQMAISEKHHRHRQLTYTNLGSSTSPSSDLKLYWWTLTPTQVFLELWMMMRFGFNFKRQYARAIITIWL